MTLLLALWLRVVAAGADALAWCWCPRCRAADVRMQRRSWRGGGLFAALCLLLASGGASAVDAGDAPRVVSVRHALLVGDDGRTYSLDGGVWLDDATLMQRAQDLERLAAENKALRSTPPTPPLAMTLAVLAALVIGATVGALLPRP